MSRKGFLTGGFLLLTTLLPLSSESQDTPFNAGVSAGINTSQISGDDLFGFHQFGVSGGLFISRDVGDGWGLELQMLYSPKGSRKTPNPEEGDHTLYKLRVHYIDVPLFLKYSLENLDIFAGPQISPRIGSAREEDHNGEFPDAGRPDFEPYDFSVHAGLGYHLSESFSMDLRFSNSILPARKHTGNSTNAPGTGDYLNRGQYHTVVSFLLKYRILGQRGEG